MAIDVITAAEVMARGLLFIGMALESQHAQQHNCLVNEFRNHYGCLPIDLAQMWHDLQTTTNVDSDGNGIALDANEANHKGFKMFMAANFFLWTNPKNSGLLASRFGIKR